MLTPQFFWRKAFMMKYEIFKEVVADTFKDYLPEQYRSMDLRVESVTK